MKITIRRALTTSVLLNVLLIGTLGGMLLGNLRSAPRIDNETVREKLSPESRRVVGAALREGQRELGPLMKDARNARARMFEILSADTLDEKAFNRAVDEMAAAQGEIVRGRARVTLDMVRELSPEERKKMASQFMKAGQNMRQRFDARQTRERFDSGGENPRGEFLRRMRERRETIE